MPAKRRALRPTWSLSLFLGVIGVAGAAEETLEEIVVNAYRAAEEGESATKTATPLLETPQSVSVITREELDARGVTRLIEAVRYNAGVLPESGGIDNRVDDVYIRGFDAGGWTNNVTLDGMRAPQGGMWNRAMFDNWNLERVEVLKGPAAVLYGQVAPGGMVNQTSKTPRAGQVQQLRLTADEYGTWGAAFDVGGAGGESARWRLVGLYDDGDTQIRHTSRRHWFLAPSARFELGAATQLTLLGLYQQDRGGSTFQFLPAQGAITPTPYGHIDNRTFIGEPDFNTYDRDIYTAGWSLEHTIEEGWTLSQNARFTHVDSLYQSTVGGVATLGGGRVLSRRVVQGEGKSEGHTVDTRLAGTLGTGKVRHSVLLGVDWQSADWDQLRTGANGTPIDVFEPVYTPGFAPALAPQISSDGDNRQSGLYLQDQIAVGGWRIALAARQDWYRDVLLNRLTSTTTIDDNAAFTGRAGVLYLFDSGFAPYVSYAESFQPISGQTDENGDPFDPTTGQQWEAGVKYQPAGARGMLTLSVYDLRQQNMLSRHPTNPLLNVQAGEVLVRGAELEGRITPVNGFSIIGALTRMHSEYLSDARGTGNISLRGFRMPRIADFMGSVWLDYSFRGGALSGLGVAGGARYVGRTWGDPNNTFRVPAYTLLDAALRYDFGARFGARDTTLTLNGSNLADRRYVANCTAATACFYGSGRTVVANVRFAW